MARIRDDYPDDEEIVKAYLQASVAELEEESWVVAAFRMLIPREPARAWRLIRTLIERAPDTLVPMIGAWQLEEFVSRHGSAFILEIEQEALRSSRFVEALANIWITRGAFPPDIEARLVTASRGAIEVLEVGENQV